MFGISGGEFAVLMVVAVVVVGPERLPRYAAQLARVVKRARQWMDQVKHQVSDEFGADADMDWSSLDPRQYDPRKIVKDAFVPGSRDAVGAGAPARAKDEPAPFDPEAT